ncbi:hypothetical protein DENSPDRAFT_102830 [Dentipellis sp. KUC8613]|nr:hypothetical protein DENSPDRAFT_102830 [Dentipellis sp. KUC8613]
MVYRIPILLVALLFRLVEGKGGAKTAADDDDDDSPPPSSSQESYSTTASTPASSSPSPSPSSVIRFQLQPPGNSTTCGNMSLTWSYSGPKSVPLTVQITDTFASQVAIVPGHARVVSTFRTLTTNVPSTASKLDWDPVDVDEGMYSAVAFDTSHTLGMYTQSPPFFVASGSDRSCLVGLPSPSSGSSATSPTNSGSPLPSASSHAGIHLSPGALAGTIAGLIAGVIIIVAAFTVPRLIRHHLPSHRNRNRREGGPYYLF